MNLKNKDWISRSVAFSKKYSEKIVQERLGHSSIEVTLNIYSHVIPSLQKTAVAEFENYLSESDFKINGGEMAGK